MDATNPPVDPGLARQVRISEQAKKIEQIVDKDSRRRRRTFYFLLLTTAFTLVLAGLALAFGRKDKDIISAASKQAVDTQLPGLVDRSLDNQRQKLTEGVTSQVLQDRKLSEMVQRQVAESVPTPLAFQSSTAPSMSLKPRAQFDPGEVQNLKQIIRDVPNQEQEMQRVFGQIDELAALTNGVKAASKEDKVEIDQRLAKLEKKAEAGQATIDKLSQKIDAVLERLDGAKDPCAQTSQSDSTIFRTYSVKENSKSEIFDLELQIELKDLNKTTLRGVIVRSGDKIIFGPVDISMGSKIPFQDKFYKYELIPIFINKRFLANDFIGLAISRVRKCPNALSQ